MMERSPRAPVFRSSAFLAMAPRASAAMLRWTETGERAAAHEKNVGGVDLQEFLLRMLAPALRWHARYRTLHNFEQCLLHTLA